MLFSLYIFNRGGKCLFYREWNRHHRQLDDPVEDQKLMFGYLFSIKLMVKKLSPSPYVVECCRLVCSRVTSRDKEHGVQRLKASDYTLHYYEVASGLRFVLTSDNEAGDLSPVLRHIYSHLFVEYVDLAPLHRAGDVITCKLFSEGLESYIASLDL
jgi:trafficking protein particle complex subunit 1